MKQLIKKKPSQISHQVQMLAVGINEDIRLCCAWGAENNTAIYNQMNTL